MVSHRSARHPLFRQRWFTDDVIVTRGRWYLRFKLSYRDLSELLGSWEYALPRARSCVGSCATPSSSRNAWVGSVADRYKRLRRKTLHLTGIASRRRHDEPMTQFFRASR